jgi:hypothetical protein
MLQSNVLYVKAECSLSGVFKLIIVIIARLTDP